jgi:uncharacterized membrane protein (UPF0127 family)
MTLIKKRSTAARARLTSAWALALVCAIAIAAAGPVAAQGSGQPQNLPTVTLQAGMRNIVAMVAKTPEQRQIGLMYRKEMAAHEGMVFVFEEPNVQCFWMRNTPLPLSAAFVEDDGTIVNIEDMQPLSDASHCSKKPVRFVLEMNKGWFAKANLKAGAKLGGPLFGKPGG